MVYIWGLLSVLLTALLATFAGFQYVIIQGYSFNFVHYIFFGALSSFGYYFYIYRNGVLSWNSALIGVIYGLIGFIIITYVQYLASFGFIIGDVNYRFYVENVTELTNYFVYLNSLKLHGFVFLIGSIILVLVLKGNEMKCLKCMMRTNFAEKVLFEGSDKYRDDVKEIVNFIANNDKTNLIGLINKRRQDDNSNTNYTFILVTCANCNTQYIVSKKFMKTEDALDKRNYTVITEVKSNMFEGLQI